MAGRQIEERKQALVLGCYPDGVLIETECNVNADLKEAVEEMLKF